MIKFIISLLLTVSIVAEAKQESFTTVNLKYINAEDAVSILKPLTKTAITFSHQSNTLIIKGSSKKTKHIITLIKKIDQPAKSLILDFIASKRKINFNQSNKTYESSKNTSRTSQSISIIERQWVSLSSGLSIPITERKRSSDGSETHSVRYKDINQNYLFKVHEINGQSIIQVKMDSSILSNNIAGATKNKKIDTTIIGKTGEWLEVASNKNILKNTQDNIYSTNKINKNHIHLYIRITK